MIDFLSQFKILAIPFKLLQSKVNVTLELLGDIGFQIFIDERMDLPFHQIDQIIDSFFKNFVSHLILDLYYIVSENARLR